MYNWPRRDISPKSILLDPRNPRLVKPGSKDTPKAILASIFEYPRVRELAKNIAENGYFPDESIIVVPEESGRKYTVIEGNRRVASCLALLKPDLLKGTRHHQYVQRLSGRSDRVKSSFQKILCIIAPSREAARRIIANKHTKVLRDRWSVYAQGNYYYQDMIDGLSIPEIAELNGVSASVVRSNVHMCVLAEAILALSWDEEKRIWLQENIDELGVTAVSRALGFSFLKDDVARFTFAENGNITADISVEEASSFLISLLSAVHFVPDDQKLTTRAVNDEATARKYFSDVYAGYRPDRSKPGERFDAFALLGGQVDMPQKEAGGGDGEAMDDVSPKPPKPDGPRRKNTGVFLRQISPFLRNEKIDALLEEALRTQPKSKYATVFLVRSLLEVVLATRVKDAGLWGDYVANSCGNNETRAGLDSLLRYSLNSGEVIPDVGDRRSIEAGLNTINSVFRKLMNLAMHSDTFLLTDSDVGDIRAKVTPVLAHLIEIE